MLYIMPNAHTDAMRACARVTMVTSKSVNHHNNGSGMYYFQTQYDKSSELDVETIRDHWL